ncbi:HEPN domain-containing protein [Paludibacterium sp.]|uniref:HEPN domain-containing protein n=1 Tax=Paludibacterium sp. TaxID=1917523 RepID=UPI0025DC63C4|nr:HEPN domain-containing protein [Paludibacterium sp.]MBV8649624.1 HEPN domain-containing protein [Paludibacterium sp.]
MKPEAEAALSLAKFHLSEAQKIYEYGFHAVAARDGYLAALHAANAWLIHHNIKHKRHKRIEGAYNKIIKDDRRFDPVKKALTMGLALKERYDYGAKTDASGTTKKEADYMLQQAAALIDIVAKATLKPDNKPPAATL